MSIPIFSRSWWQSRTYNKELEKLPDVVAAFVRATLGTSAFGGRALESPTDYIKLVNEYSGWAYACALKNANAVAQVPLRLYRGVPRNSRVKVHKSVVVRKVSKQTKDRMFNDSTLIHKLNKADDVEEVLEHPWFELMREVNRDLSGFSLWQLTVLFKQVTGNTYWLVAASPQGTPTEIWILPTQFVKIIPDEARYIKSYRYGISEPYAHYDPENICHFKYPNPKSIYYGLGQMEAAFTSASLNEDFDEFERALLDNGAYMPAVFTTKEPTGKTVLERLRKDIQRIHGGHKRAGKLGMLGTGLEMLPVSWNPKDINYAIGMKMTKEKIAGVFGVPLSKLGVEDVNRANAEAGNYSYMKDTIAPECLSNADVINQSLMPMYDDKLFVFHDECVPEDKEFGLKQQESHLQTGVTWINEVRETEGLDPVDGGEEPLVSNSLVPLSRAVAEPEPPPITMLPPADSEEIPGGEEPEEDDEKWIRKRLALMQIPLTKFIHDVVEAQVTTAAAAWMESTQAITEPYITSFSVSSPTMIDNAIPWKEVMTAGEVTFAPALVSVLDAGSQVAIDAVAPNIAFDMRSPQAIRWANRYVANKIDEITIQSRAAIREAVSRQLTEGITPQSLAKELRGKIGLNSRQMAANEKFRTKLTGEGFTATEVDAGVAEYTTKQIRQRAEMIARTETAAAFAEGNIEGYKEAGIGKLLFHANADAEPKCLALHGREYTPAEAAGVIPVHPNCRCRWISDKE